MITAKKPYAISLKLVPPSPVTDPIQPAALLHHAELNLPTNGVQGISSRHRTHGWSGTHTIWMQAASGNNGWRRDQPLTVLPSTLRSTRSIGGAWVGLVHGSDDEGAHWNGDWGQPRNGGE